MPAAVCVCIRWSQGAGGYADGLSGIGPDDARSQCDRAGERVLGLVRDSGKRFAEMKVYRENEAKVAGTVAIQKRSVDTFGRDMEESCVGS